VPPPKLRTQKLRNAQQLRGILRGRQYLSRRKSCTTSNAQWGAHRSKASPALCVTALEEQTAIIQLKCQKIKTGLFAFV
jgi:hypothetical protein